MDQLAVAAVQLVSRGKADRLAVRGVIGTVTVALVMLAALNINKLPLIGDNDVIHVEFAEAGGLQPGDAVLISGATVGQVRAVSLDRDHVVVDVVLTNRGVRLGDLTEARIVTMTLLGKAGLELEPAGSGSLESGGTIPVSRTSSPYNLTSTLNQLTETSAQIKKRRLAAALKQASSTLNASSTEIGPALDGIIAVSSALSTNDGDLRSLVTHAARVTDVLAGRNGRIASLLGAGRSLLTELDARSRVVVSLLRSARRLSQQLRLLIRDTDGVLGPALKEIDGVIGVLNRNKANLQAGITGLRGYVTAYGEAVANGPWFDAYLQNLTSPSTLAPILSGAVK